MAASAGTIHEVAQDGAWSVFTDTDPMTDSVSYGAITHSQAGADFEFECESGRPKTLIAGFRADKFLGKGFRDVEYRVDSKLPRTVTASYGDHAALPLCDGKCGNVASHPTVTLIAAMKGGKTLLVRLEDFEHNAFDFPFRIDGAQDAVKDILAACAKPNRPLEHTGK